MDNLIKPGISNWWGSVRFTKALKIIPFLHGVFFISLLNTLVNFSTF